jgi:S-methylmethionine-dependent homocysteine/selenocysteine methylase
MYHKIAQKLARGATIILDGGTGTDIQRRGVPMAGSSWCADANLTHPGAVRSVHADYIAAGADIITANTFASSPLRFNALGRDADVEVIDRAAIRIAKSAGDAVVAGSFSTMRPVIAGTDRTDLSVNWTEAEAMELFKRKAGVLADAGCDLIMMEMMRDLDYSLWATEAAVATGLPVWMGIAVERREDGKLAGFGRADWLLDDIVSALMATGAVSKLWSGPLGAYPESGYFKMPDWQFEDIISPQDLVAQSRAWRQQGVTILGGCCGIGPEHIKALANAFGGAD